MRSGQEVYVQKNSIVSAAKEAGHLSITHLLYNDISNSFAIVTVDQNIIIHSLETFEYVKQVSLSYKVLMYLDFTVSIGNN